MLTFPPADPDAAPFAPPLDEATAWELVGLAVAEDREAPKLFERIARRSPAFLAWSLVRAARRSGRVAESLEALRDESLTAGFASFLLTGGAGGPNGPAFGRSAATFRSSTFVHRLDQALPRGLRSESAAFDAQAAYDLAAALAPAFAMLDRRGEAKPAVGDAIPWESLPLPEGWKRLWRRAALRHGIDEGELQRASIDAAQDATGADSRASDARREAPSPDDEVAPLAYRALQRAAELAVDRAASEAEFERRLEAERWASMKELAYGASHEINNPLANIAARAQSLAQDEKDPDRLAKLRTIERQAFRAFTMIQNLTLVAEPPAPEMTRFDWSAALDRWTTKWQETAASKQIRIVRLRTDRESRYVDADESQAELVFDELVQNALEASPPGTTIAVEGPSPDADGDPRFGAKTLLVEIADEGSGLSPIARQRLFDPFFSGREAGRGQGFGLSKARRIVENHGGSLRCRERAPRGLAVEWRMPLPGAVGEA